MFNIGSKSATADKDAHSRSLAKAVTWRLTGSIDTFILSLLITGSIKIAGSISGIEVVTKVLLFYFHERAWALILWGRRKANPTARITARNEGGAEYKGPTLVDTSPQSLDPVSVAATSASERRCPGQADNQEVAGLLSRS
jgi:uncharacterized membrane protein